MMPFWANSPALALFSLTLLLTHHAGSATGRTEAPKVQCLSESHGGRKAHHLGSHLLIISLLFCPSQSSDP